ncbi:MAG: radical SAM family heme chaperone HemW [Clostridia bacterium]|nr:radical SAM family heme chaperone HemW [Clostridia bacterium]
MKRADKAGIYLHIPFCQSKCPYCDFYSEKADGQLLDAYFAALTDEIFTGRRAAAFQQGERPLIGTVYIGGGTPSVCGGDRIAALITAVKNAYPVDAGAEITVEANPASADAAFFEKIHAVGANRISLGLQSAVDGERRALGRLSGADRAKQAFFAARGAGFDNISLDLMLGIPGQTADSLRQSVDFCTSLGAAHISAYMLQIEEGTYFYKHRDALTLPDEDAQCDLYLQLVEQLAALGYRQYEISNFAKPGRESRHNANYWNCTPYIGVGAAAHGFFGGRRFYYPRDLRAFIDGAAPMDDGAGGTPEEYIMLTLRTAEGLDYAQYEKRFGAPVDARIKAAAQRRELRQYIRLSETGFCLTAQGFLVSNRIISEVIFS